MSIMSAITGDSSSENVKATQRFGELINTDQLEKFDEVVAVNCVDHDPAPGQQPGPSGYRQLFTEMRAAFPDMEVEVETQLAQDDQVAFAYTLTGTHKGTFMGYPATGKSISVRGVQISRFESGKMVERWGSSDQLGILKQLGVVKN